MLIDLTFNNKLIKQYFEGDDSYIPSSELIYLHEHPLIRNSFLVELEQLINKTSIWLTQKNMQGPIINKFVDATIKLGAELPTINQQNAPKVLIELRNVYKLCNSLLK